MNDIRNGIYIGGGTGIADGVLLNGKIINLNDNKSPKKSWELILPQGASVESYLSPGGILKNYNLKYKTKITSLNELSSSQYFEETLSNAITAFDYLLQDRIKFFQRQKKEIEKIVLCDVQNKIYPNLEKSFLPYVIASQVIPIFALAPILIVWFGAGIVSKIIVVFLISFFPIVIGIFDGLKINSKEMENMRMTMGARKSQIFRIIKIKIALPSFFSGLKVACVSSVIGAIVAEWIGSKSGLGWIMKVSGPLFQTERVFASILILSMIASLLFIFVKFLENKIVKE